MQLSYLTMGQVYSTREKPFWTDGVIFFEAPKSTVTRFEATGNTSDEARSKAADKIIDWQSGTTGKHSQIQTINGNIEVKSSDDLTVKARIIDEFIEKTTTEYKVYLLVQIAKYTYYEYDNINPILRKIRNRTNLFFTNGHNSYLAWGLLSGGYPLNAGTSFFGRHGGIIGIGYYLNLGFDFGGKPTYNYESIHDYNNITYWHYSAGLKFFPYKDFFLSVGYGTLGCQKTNDFNDSEGHWGTTGWRQSKGLQFTTGYDIIGNNKSWSGILSIDAGLSYDTFMAKWKPIINLKFGIAWGL